MSEGWKECRKTRNAFVREVKGKRERVDTREGITWAYPETDFVMCGSDDEGQPNEADIYPIKKITFHKSYEYVEEDG